MKKASHSNLKFYKPSFEFFNHFKLSKNEIKEMLGKRYKNGLKNLGTVDVKASPWGRDAIELVTG
jgi:hypothetical protein